MNGLEYMNKICPTTSQGKDPNREDVADAFDDGYAEGYNQAEKDFRIKWKQKWTEEDEKMMEFCCDYLDETQQKWLKSIKKRMEEQQ